MDYIEKDLAPFIEERLHLPLIDLKKSKKYRNLQKNYKKFYKEISSILSSNIRNLWELYRYNVWNTIFGIT